MQYTDFPPCKNRFGCVECRNDKKFIEHMRERFGEWECPENIPLATPLEKMPEHIQSKVSKYKNALAQKGRDIAPIPAQNQIFQNDAINKNTKDFTKTPGCMFKMMCVECRNNETFRKKMAAQFGEWECPDNIPVNTPLVEMPEQIRVAYEKREKQQQIFQEKKIKIRIALDAIEEIIPEHGLGLVDTVRLFIFPEVKKKSVCKYSKDEKIEIEKKCCGGKIRKVSGFVCEKKGEVADDFCASCEQFENKR